MQQSPEIAALRFLLNDRKRHGDIESARGAQHCLNAIDEAHPQDRPELVHGAGAAPAAPEPAGTAAGTQSLEPDPAA
jgi:hypothetical protein